jgi:hypothetical protein
LFFCTGVLFGLITLLRVGYAMGREEPDEYIDGMQAISYTWLVWKGEYRDKSGFGFISGPVL